VLADLAPVVDAITDDQLHDPTPCTDYDVGQLQDHVLSGCTPCLPHQTSRPVRTGTTGNRRGVPRERHPAAEVQAAAELLVPAVRGGAAARPLKLGDAAMPGEMALGMILWEYQVHGWDLARATGQPWHPPAAAAEQSVIFAPTMLTDDYQGEGKMFAEPVAVPQDAPPLDRLLGLSGRRPDWIMGHGAKYVQDERHG